MIDEMKRLNRESSYVVLGATGGIGSELCRRLRAWGSNVVGASRNPDRVRELAETCGVRQTARLVGVNKNTVVRLALLAGKQARQLHDELVGFSPLHPLPSFGENRTKTSGHAACDPR